jgi:dipeptidyl-peptidase-4
MRNASRHSSFLSFGFLAAVCVFALLSADASESPQDGASRFDPLPRKLHGFTVHVDPAMVEGEHSDAGARALSMLANHLERISLLARPEQLEELQRLEIWIEHEHSTLDNMQYHPSVSWLRANGCDERLAKKVHIPRARNLLSRGQLLKHPAVVLHELAHSYHDQILGFDDERILAVYKKAKKAGIYEDVLAHTGRRVRHYALTNHKEYFAEATEAYFYRNDFFPFVRAELAEFDPDGHKVLAAIWGDFR